MSTTVDNKVVEMRFDNRQFEKNAAQSLSTLEKLKQALKFNKSDVTKSSKNFDLSAISDSIEKVSSRFSNMGIVGMTALTRITNAAIDAGKKITSALTIDPVKTGLQEYEIKMGAIQVIQANDQAASMDQISSALNELNEYADKTIYNFAQMTSNVGKFVAQGLGVKEAANAVKGMANLAAASGASASDMARATYQMSQALGGVIRKIDVNSLRNANMWTTTLKDTLMDVARAENVAIDDMIKEKGTLEETLEEGWLTGQMFTKAMNIYSGVYDEAQLRAMGFNDEQIEKFQKIAKVAEEAAVEIKTFSQLIDTFKENLQSGWTQTWEAVIGNFEEAKRLWTSVSEVLSALTNGMADNRNAMLEEWKALGGRDTMIASIADAFENLLKILNPIRIAFEDVFPKTTGERLYQITKEIRRFIYQAEPSEEVLQKLYEGFKGLFSVIDGGLTFLKALATALKPVYDQLGRIAVIALRIFALVGYALTYLVESLKASGAFNAAATKVATTLYKLFDAIGVIVKAFFTLIRAVAELPIVDEIFTTLSEDFKKLKAILSGEMKEAGGHLTNFIENLRNLKKEDISPIVDKIGKAIEFLWAGLKGVKQIFSGIINTIKSFTKSKDSIEGVTDSFTTFGNAMSSFSKEGGGLSVIENVSASLSSFGQRAKIFATNLLTAFKELDKGRLIVMGFGASIVLMIFNVARAINGIPSLLAQGTKALKTLTKTIKSFQYVGQDSFGDIILKIAGAFAILAGSLVVLTMVDSNKLKAAAGALGMLVAGLILLAGAGVALSLFDKIGDFEKGIFSLVALAGAIGILAVSVKLMEGMNFVSIITGLGAIAVLMFAFTKYTGAMAKATPGLTKSVALVLVLAYSIKMLAKAMVQIGQLDTTQMAGALGSMVAIISMLGALATSTAGLSGGSMAGLLAVALSVVIMQKALMSIANSDLSLDLIIHNIEKYAIVFGALALLMKITTIAGKNAAGAGVAALLMSFALKSMVTTIMLLGGIAAMVGPLALLAGMGALLALIVELKVMFWAISDAGDGAAKAGLALIPIGIGLTLLSGVVLLLGSMSLPTLAKGVIATGILTAFMMGLITTTEAARGVKMGPILAVVAAIGVLATSLAILSFADPGGLVVAALALGGVLAVFGDTLQKISNITKRVDIAPVIAMIVGLVAAAGSLYVLADMPWAGLLAAGVALGGVMLALAYALNIAQGSVANAGALLIMSVGVAAIAGALRLLQGMSLPDIGKGLLAVGGGLTVLLLAGAAAGYFAPISAGLIAISTAMTEFGFAAMEFGIAVALVAGSLMLLSTIGPEAAANIANVFAELGTGIGTGLANIITSFIATIGQGIIDGINYLKELIFGSAPDFEDAGGNIMSCLASGVIGGLSTVWDVVSGGVSGIINFFRGDVPQEMVGAGEDMALGLAAGVESGMPLAEASGEAMGQTTLDGFDKVTGHNSPWSTMVQAMIDAGKGLLGGAPTASIFGQMAGEMVGDATGAGVESMLDQHIASSNSKLADLLNRYANAAIGESSAQSVENEEANWRKQNKQKAEAAKQTKKLNENLGGIGGKKGGGGGGGGSAGAAAKETKKLFDVLKDGQKVMDRSTALFGQLSGKFGYTQPMEMATASVQKLAEKIYEASVKSVDAETQAAKSAEDKLAEMRDAFIKFHDDIKSTIEGQTDIWGKLEQKTVVSSKDWMKNFNRQEATLNEWERDLIKLSKRVPFETLKEISSYGPEFDRQIKSLLAGPDDALEQFSNAIINREERIEQITNDVLAIQAQSLEQAATDIDQASKDITESFDDITYEAWEAAGKVSQANSKMTESVKKFQGFTEKALEKAALDYLDLKDTIQGVVDSQLDLFSKFSDDEEEAMDPQELLDNMESQNKGIRKWASDLDSLLERGLNEGLYKKLAEMGPQSHQYVEAFVEMTEQQLQEANAHFLDSTTLSESVAEKMATDFATAGLVASQKFAEGMNFDASKETIKQAAQAAVGEMVERLKDPMYDAGKLAMDMLTSGVSENASTATEAGGKVGTDTLTELGNKLTDQTTIDNHAYNLVSGLRDAMIDKYGYIIVGAGGELADKFNEAFEDGEDMHSPSRVFMEYGRLINVGLAEGLVNTSDTVEEASLTMGDRMLNSMRTVIGHIADIINGEVNVDPTIRPVVDLSGVEAGASAMDDMFGGRTYNLTRGVKIQNEGNSMRDLIEQAVAQMTANQQQPAYAGPPINMYVYGAQGQDEEEIANIVERNIMHRINRIGGTWR